MSTLPANPLFQVITPVVGLIEPAKTLFIDQLKPVLLRAVVEYVVVVVPFVNWQVGSIPADIIMAVGEPTVGVILTVRLTCADGPLQPLAVTKISTLPEKSRAQVITPVVGFIYPANGVLTFQLKPVLLIAVVE